jgi:L-seryl-tRNA(Ser) seleniumtransferase
LKVHPSNFRVEGFVSEVTVAELAALADEHGVPLIHDLGSGLLDAEVPWLGGRAPEWLVGEPGARQSLEAGAGLVTFSGDKLVGGPQAGIVVGRAELISRLRSHPLARALRTDGMTDAALASTLEAYAEGDARRIPLWRMAMSTEADLRPRVDALAAQLGGVVRPGMSVMGAGSLPGVGIPTPQITLEGEDHLHERLLSVERPILARRHEKDLLFDLRAVAEQDDETIAETVAACR